jgi:hypothetical protein
MPEPRDDDRLTGRLLLAAALGFVLFVPPLIAAFDRGGRVLGAPVVWAYLFVAWAVIIGLVAALIRRSQ